MVGSSWKAGKKGEADGDGREGEKGKKQRAREK